MSKTNFYSYAECKAVVKKNKIKIREEYSAFRQKSGDSRLPSAPWDTYKNEWDVNDFFGKNILYTYAECKAVVQNKKVNSPKEYSAFQQNSGDPKLPSTPWSYYKNEWDIYDFFDNEPLYTYAECKDVVKVNSVNSQSTYILFQQNSGDPKLPSNPWTYYKNEWDGNDFFGKESFYTYAECKDVVQENELNNHAEYLEFRQNSGDPKLPSNPWAYYKNEWDVNDFYSKNSLYTYAECKAVVQGNNVNSHSQYVAFRQKSEDPRLPNQPSKAYKNEWDFDDFLGRPFAVDVFRQKLSEANIVKKIDYEERLQPTCSRFPIDPVSYYGFTSFQELSQFEFYDLEKVCEYIQKHKIAKSEEYFEHSKTNPYLRAHPNKIEGFVGTLHYYKETPYCTLLEKYPLFKGYVDVAKELSGKGTNIYKRESLYRRFIEFLAQQNASPSPPEFLHKKTPKISLDTFIEGLAKSDKNGNSVGIIVDFIDALLLEYCADMDEDSGEVAYLPDFRNPYASHKLDIDYTARKPQETVKNILPFAYIESGRKTLCPPSAKTFRNLEKSIEMFDCDYYEVNESQIDKDDKNCVWRTRDVYRSSGRHKETVFEIWSPVRTIALFVLFELPIRGQQILWNDSGEADSQIPIINDKNEIVWEKNPHELAGKFTSPQGFIQRYEEGLGFYCTTNKTKHSEGGYRVPYMPDELAFWLIRLRDWQMKYNPITETTEWSNEFIIHKVDAKRLKHRGFEGRQCFLFRAAHVKSDVLRARPLPVGGFKNALPILLFNVQESDIPLADWTGEGEPLNVMSRYTSKFTPHSLRASLITAYIIDHSINPALVAKLVGHASLVMTIYYAKVTEPAMRKELQEAEKRALKGKVEQIQAMLMAEKFENLKHLLIDNSNGAFLNNLANQFEKGAVVYFDWGLCPVGGQSCDDGGELVAEKSTFRLPVPKSAVLGSRNCPQCRFFLTGYAYLGGLKTLADMLSHKASEAKVEVEKYAQLREDLKDERDECESRGVGFTRRDELNNIQSAFETTSLEFSALIADLIQVYRLADGCLQLLSKQSDETGTENVPMLTNSNDIITLEPREVSTLEQLDTVCKNAEVFTVGNPKHAIMERTRALDILLHHNEISSSIFKLSEEHQLKIGSHLTTLLVQKLGGWSNLDAVSEGRNKLNELLGPEELKSITKTIKNLDKPIHLEGFESMGDVA